jgi:hypothetical protein
MHRFAFAFAFAFALAACGELEPVETDAGPEVDAGLVEDTLGGFCDLRCFENNFLADWQPRVGAADDQVTCCECRREVLATEVRDICVDSIVSGDRIDNAVALCPNCRDVP